MCRRYNFHNVTVQVNYKLVEHISVNLIKVLPVIVHNMNKEIWLMCNWDINNEFWSFDFLQVTDGI